MLLLSPDTLTVMPIKKDKNLKLYYSIKEVATMFALNESTLRYWEKEFPQLQPKTNFRGVRQYTQHDIDTIRVIYNQVKVRGFKLDAVKRMLNVNRTGVDKSSQILDTLISARDQLQDLKKQLDVL